MAAEKETRNLIHELRDSASFSDFTEENEAAFVSDVPEDFVRPETSSPSLCPFCQASLPKDASFCPSCMQLLKEREIIPKQKAPFRRRTRCLLILLAAAVLLIVILSAAAGIFLSRKASLSLPSAEEFRLLLLGASDENDSALWSPESLHLQKTGGGYDIYEADTTLSEAPVRAAFSEDGKRLYFALSDLSEDDLRDALKLAKTAFSAVYRYAPENLEELIGNVSVYRELNVPGEELAGFLGASGIPVSEDARILVSLPIRTQKYADAPVASVYQIQSSGRTDLILLFEERGS